MPINSSSFRRAATPISVEDRADIAALVTEYAYLVDHDRLEETGALCAAIPDRDRASAGRRTHHQITNVRLEPAGADRVMGTIGVVVHGVKSGVRSKYIDFVGEYRDEYVRANGGWRIERRELIDLADM